MRKTALAALGLIAALAAGPASAADIYGNSLKDEPIHVARAENWGGFFAGGTLGYTFAKTDLDIGGFAQLEGLGSEGFNGCGLVGVRRQFGAVVAGIEGRGCVSAIETDLSIGGVSVAGYEADWSAAGYATLGVNALGGLASVVGGYKVAHVDGKGLLLSGWDDQFEGFSGGLMWETKLRPNVNLGLEAIYDAYEEKNYGGLTVDPSALNVAVRLTTQF
jgi:hypothetical protein